MKVIISHKQSGIVLVINLIILLLITVLATSMFKNALNQQQMANSFHLNLSNQQRALQLATKAKSALTVLINDNADLTVNQPGFFASEDEFAQANFSWSNAQHVTLDSKLGKYVVVYKGIFPRLFEPDKKQDHHIFDLFVKSQSNNHSEVIQQHFIAIKQPSI